MSESTVEEVSEKETDENEEGIIELNDTSLNSVNSIIQELQDKRERS